MKRALAVMGTLAGLLASGSLAAGTSALAQGTDAVYSNHGAFVVQYNTPPGRPIVCYAATQANARTGPVDINIMYNGQDWVISFPYPAGSHVSGGLVLDGISDAFSSEPLGDGYNGFIVAAAFVADLQRGRTFTLDIPSTGRVSFPLNGSSRALNDVRTCVRNQGARPRTQTSQPAQRPSSPTRPVPARQTPATVASNLGGGPSAWGGFNIVGTGQSSENRYADVRGWQVLAANHGGNHAYCVGTYQHNGVDLRLGWDGGQWQLAVPVPSTPDWSGFLEVDGDSRMASGTAIGNWTVIWLAQWEVDRLSQGNQAIVSIGRRDYDFALSGSAAAILKVEECQTRQGVAARQTPASSPVRAPSQPAVQRPALGTQASQRDVLGSVWYETESGWQGTWTRLGSSNQFQAVWTHPNGSTVHADLTITMAGNDVSIIRRDTFGPGVGQGCNYNGTIHGQSVSGHYACDWGGQLLPWSASIN